ncbi:Predicted O-linked N-acetylglucosamine transferase, SPINDLY family,putative PEP-CTERM system TPR-repeat lipoprotein,Tetratricopeptide repeat [Chlamydia serpentis]|uniref:Predicted O-linked N-acetylglucosamine transferase, SPINDLY family,putative PEP-CTERM system TPR-repeat lipoprotein,Tetratricopeptide repeat n=1 Tax=Chlamydia serpentis TaxID=1967782 RepID=A0A2R8FC25_9CHLA|nr:tetratricopeptide repeat protein [Chlamydia serpentis]SPN73953.1 Predicted O-linked N-acetylglucosamine transferase, SPINDLY family,putative PEP-CTERM system TPR-repeat lipoprotein,Tetratricopeptide repeat [Chlamydia serpentis]
MWLVILWALAASLVIALVVKGYYRFVHFRRYATQVMREVRLSMELKEWGLAEQQLLPILKKRFYRRQCLFEYMRILRKMQRFEESERLLAEAQKLRLSGPYFFLEIAYKAYRYGAFKESSQAFAAVPQELFEEEDAAKYASALVHLGYLDAACSLIEPWISPLSHQETFITMGHIYFTSKRYQDAIDFYNRAQALDACPIEVTYNLAQAYRITSNYTQAGKLFRKLLSSSLYKEEALLNIGLCEQKLGRPGKALLIYQSSDLWSRGDALLMKYAALAAMDQRDYTLAERCWDLALRSSTFATDYKCALGYGFSLCRLRKYKDAERVYCNIIKNFPDCLTACKALAWLCGVGYATILSSKEGLVYAKKAVQLDHSSETLELLSACEARCGNFDTAYEIQSFLSLQDTSLQEKQRRSQILRILRKKLPLDDHHIVEVDALLAA